MCKMFRKACTSCIQVLYPKNSPSSIGAVETLLSTWGNSRILEPYEPFCTRGPWSPDGEVERVVTVLGGQLFKRAGRWANLDTHASFVVIMLVLYGHSGTVGNPVSNYGRFQSSHLPILPCSGKKIHFLSRKELPEQRSGLKLAWYQEVLSPGQQPNWVGPDASSR